MKISKNSFIMKVIEFNNSHWYWLICNEKEYQNLCFVMNKFLISCVGMLIVASLLLLFFHIFVTNPLMYFFGVDPSYLLFVGEGQSPYMPSAMLGLVVLSVTVLFILSHISRKLKERNCIRRNNKQPSAFSQWTEDKRNKVCRKIEITDD